MPIDIKLQMNGEDKPEGEASSRLLQNVTFFGDSAIPDTSPIYKSVWEAARLLAEHNYTIVNGGGPGIMKAATDGAESVDGKTMAVYWQPKLASFFEGRNLANVTDEYETCSNYMMRTLGLIEKGDAYVVCKGGTGTISEFGMVWALAKLYFGCHKPVILYGDFWDPLIKAIQEYMYIDEKELGVLYRAQTPQEILTILEEHEKKIQPCKDKKFEGDETAFLVSAKHEITQMAYDIKSQEYVSEHPGNQAAQDQLDEFLTLVNPPAKVLDLGTGIGHDAKYLSKKYTVTGIEISPRSARIARFENPGMEIIIADMAKVDYGENIYKGIWARNSLHHLEEQFIDPTLAKVSKALVPGGIFYVIVRSGEGETVETDIRNYQKIERFYHFFSKDELINRASNAGLDIIRVDLTQRSHEWIIGVFKKPE